MTHDPVLLLITLPGSAERYSGTVLSWWLFCVAAATAARRAKVNTDTIEATETNFAAVDMLTRTGWNWNTCNRQRLKCPLQPESQAQTCIIFSLNCGCIYGELLSAERGSAVTKATRCSENHQLSRATWSTNHWWKCLKSHLSDPAGEAHTALFLTHSWVYLSQAALENQCLLCSCEWECSIRLLKRLQFNTECCV